MGDYVALTHLPLPPLLELRLIPSFDGGGKDYDKGRNVTLGTQRIPTLGLPFS